MKRKATKTDLKRVRMLKEYLIEVMNSDARPKMKKRNDSLKPGEVPIGNRYGNMVMAPITERERAIFRQRLKEVEKEEKRIEAELAASESGSKAVKKPATKKGTKKGTKK
jgi:hypothetical protein